MSNEINAGVIKIDSTGAISTADFTFSGIQILPNNATWAVKLSDTADNTIVSLDNNSPIPVLTPKQFTGLKAVTLTNITEVLVWIN